MKKIQHGLILLLALVLLVSAGTVVASAEDRPISFTIATVTDARMGQTVAVDFMLDDANIALGAFTVQFAFDADCLRPVLAQGSEDVVVLRGEAAQASNCYIAVNNQTLKVSFLSADGLQNAGTVFTVYFEVIGAIPQDTVSEISARVTLAETARHVPLDPSVNSGGVAMAEDAGEQPGEDPGDATPTNITPTDTDKPDDFLRGDVDESGKVNASDALMALKAAVGKITLTERQTLIADLDEDEKVTASDALAILKIAVGK